MPHQPPHQPIDRPDKTLPKLGRPSFLRLASIALGTSALTLTAQALGFLQLLEWAVLDGWFCLRPLEHHEIPITIVTIDDTDIAASGQWPLTDQKLTELITLLNQHEPAAIGLDLYRDLPVEPGHKALEDVFSNTPNLIGIEKIVTEGASLAIAPPPALKAVDQVGFNDLVLDGDGHMRRHLISLRQEETTKFALGTTLALGYLETYFNIVPEPLENSRLRLGKAEFSPLRPNAGAYANADVGGYQMLANYLRLADGMSTVSMTEVMSDQISPDKLKNKIVFIGTKADSNWGDRFYTPYSQTSDDSWSGVEIHANLTAQLIAGALYGRSPLRTPPEPVEWAWILLWTGIGVRSNRDLAPNWRWWLRPIILVGGLTILTYLLFLGQYWLPFVAPWLGFSSAWFATQGYSIWHKLRQDNQLLELTVQQRTQELQSQNQALEKAQVAAEVANQAKSNFLAHITHELRTPLTAILGFGELLAYSTNLPAEEREYAKTINQGGEHLLSLINNVLELSKIETATTELNPETIELSTFLTALTTLFQAQANAKQVRLTLDIANALPAFIEVDSSKLRQVIINLLGNALKFTQTGRVTLQVRETSDQQTSNQQTSNQQLVEKSPQQFSPPSTHSQSSNGSSPNGSSPNRHENWPVEDWQIEDWLSPNKAAPQSATAEHTSQTASPLALPDRLTFSVTDTGPGLTPEDIEQLFQPFVQTSAGKQLGSGSGLGLVLARQCVELMGGTIEVSSTYGQGSQFSFHIPVTPVPMASSTAQPSIAQPSSAPHPSTGHPLTESPLTESPAAEPSAPTDAFAKGPAGYRILIVDDEANNRRLLSKLLEAAHFDIKLAESGATALQTFKKWHPHLVLLDIHLPDFDGYEVARRIRAYWEKQNGETQIWKGKEWENNEPILLATTAGVLQDNYADLLAAGCDDVIWKPIKAETLFTKISEYLEEISDSLEK
ncbi:MAG: CHASE2 domain-containing protein [Cyanobacteria bacterium P01_F01_bin.53]